MINAKMPILAIGFDMTGVTPWNPLSSPSPEPGPHAGTIIDVDPAYNAGKSSKFTIALDNGQETDIYIGNEPGEKGGNKKKWAQALCMIAPNADVFLANLKANPNIQFDQTTTFRGKPCYVLVVEVPGQDEQGRPNLPNKEFMTKAQFEAAKAGNLKLTASAPKTNGAPATAGATPSGTTMPPAAAGGDVLGKLFGG